jgi:hypothetical protein
VEPWWLEQEYSAVNGWDKNTLKPGDVITAIGYRLRVQPLQKVVMTSGKEMYLYGPPALRTPLGVRGEANPTSTGGGRRP